MLLDQMYKYFQTPNANNQIALTKKNVHKLILSLNWLAIITLTLGIMVKTTVTILESKLHV